MQEKSLISILALNIKGQLGRMTSFFGENNLNILRLVLSSADKNGIIHRTIAFVEGDREMVNEACKNLANMENVLKVDNFMTDGEYIEKELCLLKISLDDKNLSNIENLVRERDGKIIFTRNNVMVYQIISEEENINDFAIKMNLLSDSYEIIRSGVVATTIENSENCKFIKDYLANQHTNNEN